jgi:hypothetical protein
MDNYGLAPKTNILTKYILNDLVYANAPDFFIHSLFQI